MSETTQTPDPLAAETFAVPVAGGDLEVHRWPGEGPVVLAVHGITANGLAWAHVAGALEGSVQLVAPDLRGRGGSGTLPPPYGMAAHADDLVAVLDHLGVERAVLVGHSMGGFVVATTATRHPDRVAGAVLVDGGLALTMPEGLDVDAALDATLGPAIQRLSRTFASREDYREFWRQHPAFGDGWDEVADAYTQHDLVGTEPELRSSCALDAVRADGRDMLTNPDVPAAVHRTTCPTTLLWAPRGLMDEPQGLYDESRLAASGLDTERVPTVLVEDVNHYSILLAPHGAEQVADHVLALAGVAGLGR